MVVKEDACHPTGNVNIEEAKKVEEEENRKVPRNTKTMWKKASTS